MILCKYSRRFGIGLAVWLQTWARGNGRVQMDGVRFASRLFFTVGWANELNAPQRAMSISQAAARQIIIGAIALYVIVAVLG